MSSSPFHDGERAVQARVGVRERLEQIGPRIIRGYMPDQHRELFAELPFVFVGSRDANGRLWASLLSGRPGFVSSPTARSLVVRARTLPGDPLRESLRPGQPLGLLGIELETRRRNRANGRIELVDDSGFALRIEQSFGNCPKYIQARAGWFQLPQDVSPAAAESSLLSPAALALLSRSDTTFIATSSPRPERGGAEGIDVSHRGGPPGFITSRVVAAVTTLTMPDYLGNFMFNTLGNLEHNPRAGLLALDFEAGELLSVTGRARVIWEGPEVEARRGAERVLELRVESGWLWRGVVSRFSAPEPSPHLP